MQGGNSIIEEQTLYERVPDREVLEAFLQFMDLR